MKNKSDLRSYIHQITRRVRRFTSLFGVSVISIVLVILRGFDGYQTYTGSSYQLSEQFSQYQQPVVIQHFSRQGNTGRYLLLGGSQPHLIVLIHGAPGSIQERSQVIHHSSGTLKNSSMLIVDRLGYAGSYDGRSVPDIQTQSERIRQTIKHVIATQSESTKGESIKIFIVGHSYGGTLAAKLLIDHHPNIAGALIVSAAVDPTLEVYLSIAKLLDIPGVSYIVPSLLTVSNDEKKTHVAQLEQYLAVFPSIQTPSIILHGDQDRLVPTPNAYYLHPKLGPNAQMVILTGAGHPLHMTHPDIISTQIQRLLDL